MKALRSLNEVPLGVRIALLAFALVAVIAASWKFDGLDAETQRLLLVLLSAAALSAFVVEFLEDAKGPTTLKLLVSMGTLAATCTAYFAEFPGTGVGLHEWLLMSLVIIAGLGIGLFIALYEYWFTRLSPRRS